MNTTLTLPTPNAVVQLDATKDELTAYADHMVSKMVEDGGDVLLLLAQAAKLKVLAERLEQQAKAATVNEVRAYGKGGVSKLGVTFTVKETGVSYGYDHDSTWQALNEVVTTATEARKVRESYLKAVPIGGVIETDEQTGETRRVFAASKRGGDSVVMKIE